MAAHSPDSSMPAKPGAVRSVGRRGNPVRHDVGDGRRLTAPEIAKVLRISEKAVYNRVARGLTGASLLAPPGAHVRRYEVDGKLLTIAEIATRVGVTPGAIEYRIKLGMQGKALLARPSRKGRP